MGENIYKTGIKWTGNTGKGTESFKSYQRTYLMSFEGKPDLQGSSDSKYMGDITKYNPEELLLAALSSCHMLWYLHICSENHIIVTSYDDSCSASLDPKHTDGGRFLKALLQPNITITDAKQIEKAKELHEEAHKKCFIANSLNFKVEISPKIEVSNTVSL